MLVFCTYVLSCSLFFSFSCKVNIKFKYTKKKHRKQALHVKHSNLLCDGLKLSVFKVSNILVNELNILQYTYSIMEICKNNHHRILQLHVHGTLNLTNVHTSTQLKLLYVIQQHRYSYLL